MARNLTPAMRSELLAKIVMPVLIIELVFDDETVRLWSESGTLNWNGEEWLGAGQTLAMGPVHESASVQATGLTMALSGIPTSILALAFEKDYLGRPATVWLGCMKDNALIADPAVLFAGPMDRMNVEESGETCTVGVTVESRFADIRRPRTWFYTQEDQQIYAPEDLFFEYVPSLQDKVIEWQDR